VARRFNCSTFLSYVKQIRPRGRMNGHDPVPKGSVAR
jgi:hypothetical protein